MEQAALSVGLMRAGAALGYLVVWSFVAEDLGRWPVPEDLVERKALSRSQAYRQQAAMRRAFFPVEPSRVWEVSRAWVADAQAERGRRSAAVLAMAPAVLR
jgi:hypothetical protein